MSDRLARADGIVATLTAAGIRAYVEPADAAANLPAVLVPPPALRFDLPVGATATWGLVALAADPSGGRASWADLDALVETVEAELYVESATPTTYTLPTAGDALPAYTLTIREAVD